MNARASVHAAATGIGSLPVELATRGRVIDPRESARIVADSFPDLPHIVELPGRGAGADMVGRTAAMLAQVSPDFAVQTVPSGWRRTSRPGVDLERASRWLDEDFDALAEVFADYQGPFKLQICGPLTWCRVVEDGAGEPSLRDSGFINDVVTATSEAAHAQVVRLRRLVPGVTDVVVQFDEPALTQVLIGSVPTASGRSRISPPDTQRVRAWFTQVVHDVRASDRALQMWLHSCADASHISLAHATGFDGVSCDVTQLRAANLDDVGVLYDAGVTLALGVVTPSDWHLSSPAMLDAARVRAEQLRSALSIAPEHFSAGTTLTATCGLAGASAPVARSVMSCVHAAARSVVGETMTRGE